MSLNCIWIDLRICWMLDRLAPYKLPRVLVSLLILIYQQSLSTTLYYSYLGMPALIEIRSRNGAGEITDITFLTPQRVSFVLRLRQSFPEDCVRLKLSSTRASQAGLREMMTRRRVRDWLGSRVEETIQPAPGYKAFRG